MAYDESSLIDPTDDVARERALMAATEAHPDVAAAYQRWLVARATAADVRLDFARLLDDDDPHMAAQVAAQAAYEEWERLAANYLAATH